MNTSTNMALNNKWISATLLAAAASFGVAISAANAAPPDRARSTSTTAAPTTSEDPFANLPATMSLDAIVRDFKARNETGGHPDFEAYTNSYITTGLVRNQLDSDGKPVFNAARGMQITSSYKDHTGRIINPAMYNAAAGDTAGSMSMGGSDQLSGSERFAQWYRDVSGTNASMRVPLVFNRIPNTARYVFDSATDAPYRARGGFFPIDGELLGNFGSTGHNFSFTTEISTTFLFEREKNHVFTFTGDDDVWVFIDGKLVLDLGGTHPRQEQSLELNRLSWLTDGQTHTLKVFHAERHTNGSNFRIETSLQLTRVEAPPTTAMYD